MTLVLAIAGPSGMWQSSDHRLTEAPGGQLITDASMKHLSIKTPDGRALLSYSGFGWIDGEDVSDWLRKTLRGEVLDLEATAELIAANATAKISPLARAYDMAHVFVLTAFLRNEPFLVGIANIDPPFGINHSPQATKLAPAFRVFPFRMTGNAVLAGGGASAVLADDVMLLQRLSTKRPRHPVDYLKLLAGINERAASSGKPGASGVSKGCLCSYLPAAEDESIDCQFFRAGMKGAHRFPPFLHNGIDMTEMMNAMPRKNPETGGFIAGELERADENREQALRRSVQRERGGPPEPP